MRHFGSVLTLLASMTVAATPTFAAGAKESPPPAEIQESPGSLQLLDRNNSVLLLVDEQVGLMTGVRDNDTASLRHNVVALAKAAKIMGVPVVLTATGENGPFGPVLPELRAVLPDVKIIPRTQIDAWRDPEVRRAIEATGRRKIVIAGVSLEVCAGFPAITAKAAGYDTYVVLDASGTFSQAKHDAGVMRLVQAGVIPTDYATVGVEWLRDNADPKASELYSALDMSATTLVAQLYQAKK